VIIVAMFVRKACDNSVIVVAMFVRQACDNSVIVVALFVRQAVVEPRRSIVIYSVDRTRRSARVSDHGEDGG